METSREIAIPGTGELVDLSDVPAVVSALSALRDYERLIGEAKSVLTYAVVDHATQMGVRSIELPDGSRAEVSAPTENFYDPEILEAKLLEAGMPQERIDQIIERTVIYKVKAGEAKKAAKANPAYADALEASRTEQSRNQYITIRRKQ